MLPFAASLLASTLRIRFIGASLPERSVIMFWHGNMFAGWHAVRKKLPVALVSSSKDGGYLASVLERWGYQLVRGSSSKSGKEALSQAVAAIERRSAKSIVITPDGPRGPAHRFKRGAFHAARDTGSPLIFLHIRCHSAFHFLKSWDHFSLPKPFSTITIEAIPIDISAMPSEIDAQRLWLDELASRLPR